MKNFKAFGFIMLSCIVATSALADIYEWTDENGVRHYSNRAPAENAKVLLKTKEEPYDEGADRARQEAERQERLELARLELARQEAELKLREAEAERKLAAAERLAEEARRKADYLIDEAATNSRIIYRGGGYWCPDYGYDCYYPIHHRWYYKKKHSRRSLHNISRWKPIPRHRKIKKRYRTNKPHIGHKFRGQNRLRHNGNPAGSQLSHRVGSHRRVNGIRTHSLRMNGRANAGWRSSGFGRRH
ncbi:hypothetical protein D1AOALGA4SA_5334 [Olavius algarvensis Delta 1 endosymbiont]|nr:hypothetical protein D1AOALGA4SA_5334 [Olavius algarvensis Delta 1 endosymbiont]